MAEKKSLVENLRNSGAVVEFYNILMIRAIFPPSMSREQIINSAIGMALTSDYDCHEIETLPDDSIRLTIHLDS
ncbi:MAG: hypothetical protein Q8Q89_02025 [bacterium]|nr:hypothetical protein [bacterium]